MAIPQLESAWNTRQGSSVAAAFTADGVRIEYALPGARLEGRAAIASQAGAYISAIPDCRLEIRGVFEGARGVVTLEWTLCGTHTGDLPGLPARGEAVALEGVSVCRMEGELIGEERVYWDAATLLAGAGVLR